MDAIFVGHQHLQLPGADFAGLAGVDAQAGRLAGVPAAMAGFWAGHIGVIDLTLEHVVREADAALARSPDRREGRTARRRSRRRRADPAVLAATQGAHEATLAYVRAPVGEMAAPLASYFAMIGDDACVRIVHDAQLCLCAAG